MPRLEGTVGWVDCIVQDVHEAGDHYLVIGRVEDLGHGDARQAPAVPPRALPHGRARSEA